LASSGHHQQGNAMNKFIATALLLFASLGYTSSASSQTQTTTGKQLDVAFYEAGYLYTNGQGIDKDVVDEIKSRGGFNFNYVFLPRVRIWKDLEAGTLPLSVSGIQTPARDKFAFFVPYIMQANKALVTNAKYTTPESIMNDKAARIAVVRGFKHGDFFDGLVEKIRANGGVSEVASIRHLFMMLQAGDRVDMIISQPAFYAKELKDLGIEAKVTVYDWDRHSKNPILLGLILSKSHFSEQDAARIREIVKTMKQDGTLKKIFSKYLPKKDVDEALNF
jgi:polar amino acid transport system substrate-binding protein